MREGTQAGGVGEEGAGSQRRSLMQGSILELQDHALAEGRRLTTEPPRHPRNQVFKQYLMTEIIIT